MFLTVAIATVLLKADDSWLGLLWDTSREKEGNQLMMRDPGSGRDGERVRGGRGGESER